MRKAVVIFITFSLSLLAAVRSAAADDLSTRQGILDPAFRTLQVVPEWDWMAPPVINLADPGERIVISFDELASERRYLRYSLTHCDAAWRPEGLVDSEFLDSFNEGTVDDYDYSQATVVQYVHYRITIPNGQIRITRPGNYLLRVYDEDDPDTTLLQARFGVCDFSASVYASASPNTDIDARREHQQLAIRVDTRNLQVDDPFGDLRVVITQNGRPDTERVITTPQRINGKEMIYEHMPSLIFPAGNEYRRFETSSVNYPGIGVQYLSHDTPVYNAWLYADTPRSKTQYLYDSTQQGRFVVRAVDAPDDSDTQADYVLTHFTLQMPQVDDADIFLEGDLTGRSFDPLSRMIYNHATGAYEQSLLLKQGAYNYQYVAIPLGGATGGLTSMVEGDKYQTVNEYIIKVYHRPRGARFDSLVGITRVLTRNQ